MQFSVSVYVNLLFWFAFAIKEMQSICSETNPCQIEGGQPFESPEVLNSKNGELEVRLTVQMASLTYDWLTIQRRTYLGMLPGPTWRIRRGDNITTILTNELEMTYEDERPPNTMRHQNFTNLHTHGFHVSGESPSDNVFVEVKPGEKVTYKYNIEEDHPAGTYWYHAHLHGSTMFQVQSGLAGLIIIEDPTTGNAAMPNHLEAISCPNNCQHEVPMLFQPTLVYADRSGWGRGFGQLQATIKDANKFRNLVRTKSGITLEEWMKLPENNIDHFTTNGILFPVLNIDTGQRKRFRMVNAGGTRTLQLMITDVNGKTPTSACDVWEISFDGMYLNNPREPHLGRTLIVPASKCDWIVVCNEPGNYELRSISDDFDSCSIGKTEEHNGLLVSIQVRGKRVSPQWQDESLPRRPFYISDFQHFQQDQVTGFFVVEANRKQHLNRALFSNPTLYRYKMPLGTVQEWYLTNSDPVSGHPIHIHVNHFQIVSYNNYTGPVSVDSVNSDQDKGIVFYSQKGEMCHYQSSSYKDGMHGLFKLKKVNGSAPCKPHEVVNHREHAARGGRGTLGYVEPGEFRDVVMVPPLSNITIRFLTHKFTGRVVIHCHILAHEDRGMMMTAYITDHDEDVKMHQKSGNALPGTCSGITSLSINTFVLLLPVVILFKSLM